MLALSNKFSRRGRILYKEAIQHIFLSPEGEWVLRSDHAAKKSSVRTSGRFSKTLESMGHAYVPLQPREER